MSEQYFRSFIEYFCCSNVYLYRSSYSTYCQLVTGNHKHMREQHGPTSERHTPAHSQGQAEVVHFGNYELVRRIDVGGMGEVYLARQLSAFGRLVAIKIIRSDLVHDLVARQRFLREAEVSAHLKHEHILQLVEFGEEQGRLFLVTPYIEGGTLSRRLLRGPLSLTEIQQLFAALVRAVAYIHRRGVVHRDLKPSNIMLDQEDEQVYVRLIDFGIAMLQGASAAPQLTTAGNELGTAAYMAPERLNGISAPSNDIYSLGVILYQMITGHLPASDTPHALPPALQAVVKRCIAPDPLNRYASADELLKAFEDACQQMNNGVHPHASLTPESGEEDITPRYVATDHSAREVTPASAPAQDSLILRPIPSSTAVSVEHDFRQNDYAMPTTHISMEDLKRMSLKDSAVVVASPPVPPVPAKRRSKRKRRSLVSIISVAIVLLLFLIAGIMYVGFEASINATVTITPVVHSLSMVLPMQAQPQLQNIDSAHSAIPARTAIDTESGNQSGPTTQPTGCIFALLCPRVVTYNDANKLATALQAQLRTQITTKIQQQIAAQHGTMVGSIAFTDKSVQVNPSIGSPSDTVNISLTEAGSAEYVVLSDAQKLAKIEIQQLVQKQYGANYVLQSQMTQIGQPVIKAVDANGNVTLAVAVAGLVEYQFPNSELSAMQSHLKDMKIKNARAYLLSQPGVDPTTATVIVSYGDTIPGNSAQIRVVHLNPNNLPSIQLPTVTPQS